MPTAAARRRIIRQASGWLMGCSDSDRGDMPAAGAEQKALAVLGDAGGVDIGAQRLGKGMVARHGVVLAAFLVQAEVQPAPFGRRSSTFIFSAAPMRAKE